MNEMHALVDPSSTHSYICIEHLSDKFPSIELLAYDMLVTSPLRHSVRVNRVYKNYPLIVRDRGCRQILICCVLYHTFGYLLCCVLSFIVTGRCSQILICCVHE